MNNISKRSSLKKNKLLPDLVFFIFKELLLGLKKESLKITTLLFVLIMSINCFKHLLVLLTIIEFFTLTFLKNL